MLNIKRYIVSDFETNCYFVEDGAETAIIDPGGNPDILRERLGGRPVKYIILTHGHPDHTEAALSLKEATGAPIICHKEEIKLLDFAPDRTVREGDVLEIGQTGFKVLSTPGHTPGSICLLSADARPDGINAQGVILTGDTLFLNGFGRTDLEWGDEAAMERSLVRLKGIIKPGMLVLPGHGGTAAFRD